MNCREILAELVALEDLAAKTGRETYFGRQRDLSEFRSRHPIAWANARAVLAEAEEPKTWRCFHCDEIFTEHALALEHFGFTELQRPACQIDVKHVRWLEDQHHRGVQDDTEALRTIRGLASEHEQLRCCAEENGYARGLADAKRHPEELGLAAIAARNP